MDFETIVIGGGAIGLAIADELSRRGRAVGVLERDRLPRAATGLSRSQPDKAASTAPVYRSASSWAASGILPPANFATATDPIDRLRGLSHRLFPQWARRIQEDSGIDCQLDACGGWYLADTVGEIGVMAGMVSYWRELEIECQEAPIDQLVRREPALRPWAERGGLAKAWWVPGEWQIRCPLYLDALAVSAHVNGARLVDCCGVRGIEERDGGVSVTADKDGDKVEFRGQQVVVCGGVLTGLADPRLRLAESLVPVRGQILLLEATPGLFSSVINIGHRYLVPRKDGQVLVGSCEEEVGFQHGTTPVVLEDLRGFARELCPSLAKARELQAWSGLRPLTFDGFPMLGKLPDSDAVFVAAGHFRSGVHLSPGTAVCMAELMTGGRPPVDLDAFRVGKQQQHAT
jgi:glycine oxidase